MFFYEGLSCPVCGKAFEEHEDIVSCPVCGAPHHRDCWKSEGHCHFEDKHGTDDQWSREKTIAAEKPRDTRRCPHCGAENSPFVEFCGHCGRPIEGQAWQSAEPQAEARFHAPPGYGEYAPYRIHPANRFTGVDKDTVIAGVSAEDLATVVDQNTIYYLPRFAKMDREKSAISFNGAAFLFTPYWLMFRKNYLFGALTLLFSLLSTALSFYIRIVKLGWAIDISATDMYNQMQTIIETGDARMPYLYLMSGITIVSFLISLAFGLFGNRLYLQTCVGRINKLKTKAPSTYKTQLRTVGSVSLGLAMLVLMISQIVPMCVQLLMI